MNEPIKGMSVGAILGLQQEEKTGSTSNDWAESREFGSAFALRSTVIQLQKNNGGGVLSYVLSLCSVSCMI